MGRISIIIPLCNIYVDLFPEMTFFSYTLGKEGLSEGYSADCNLQINYLLTLNP